MTVRFRPREREILRKLCQGFDAKQIAADLEISESTAHNHIRNLYRKAQLAGAHQLPLYVLQQPVALRAPTDLLPGLHQPRADCQCCVCRALAA